MFRLLICDDHPPIRTALRLLAKEAAPDAEVTECASAEELTFLLRQPRPFDFLTLGELFQNNHHRFGQSPNFGTRWFEIDPTYYVIRVMAACNILRFNRTQTIALETA